jgi:hypothetical protein
MVMRGRSCIIEFDCASAIIAPGTPVGAAQDVGNNLLNQTVVAVADNAHAIGMATHQDPPGVAGVKVQVELLSRFVPDA